MTGQVVGSVNGSGVDDRDILTEDSNDVMIEENSVGDEGLSAESRDESKDVDASFAGKLLDVMPIESQSSNSLVANAGSDIMYSGMWGACPWEIDNEGNLIVHAGQGASTYDSSELYFWGLPSPWSRHGIKTVTFEDGVILPESCEILFEGEGNLTSVDISSCDFSRVKSMHGMFRNCGSISSLDVSGWDISNVTDMGEMFEGCKSLSSFDASTWNTSNVTDMGEMFGNCYRLVSLDISAWDVGNVRDANYMFYDCEKLSSLDVSGWDTSALEDVIGMFERCESLTSLDLSGWDTSRITSFWYMFLGCERLSSLDVSGWDTSNVTDMVDMFTSCRSLSSLDLSDWDTSNVSAMNNMFRGCESLSSLDVSGWNTARVRDTSWMFAYCKSLTSLDLSSWDTANVTEMEAMFDTCPSLSSITVGKHYMFYRQQMYGWVRCEMFPGATSDNGKWWSVADQRWYSKDEITENRSGIADRYTNVPTSEGFEPNDPGDDPNGHIVSRFIKGSRDLWIASEFHAQANEKGSSVLVPITVDWDDEWFHGDSDKYNHDLAKVASLLMSAVYEDDATLEDDKALKESDFSKFERVPGGTAGTTNQVAHKNNLTLYNLDALGFDYTTFFAFNPRKDEDYQGRYDWESKDYGINRVGVTFGIKWIDDGETPLVAVIVRGTVKNLEWVSNFNLADSGESDYAEALYEAKCQVMDALSNWVSTVGEGNLDLSKAVFLVTGHSRGAAVANLLGRDLDNGEIANTLGESSADRTYVYTFASPMASRASDLHDDKYNNIFNIVNPDDGIPKFALQKWGFGRYGVTMALPSKSNTSTKSGQILYDWSWLYSRMQKKFQEYSGGVSHEHYMTGSLATDIIFERLGDTWPTVKSAYTPMRKQFLADVTIIDIFKDVGMVLGKDDLGPLKSHGMHLAKTKWFSQVAAILTGLRGYSKAPVIKTIGGVAVASVLKNSYDPEFAHAHMSETYIAWVMSGGNEIFMPGYRTLGIRCPVDVTVYDQEDNVVCSIVDDVVDKDVLENGLPAMVIDGEKCIDIPCDEAYRVVVTGTDNGKMDVVYREKSNDCSVISQITYTNMPLEDGSTYEVFAHTVDEGMDVREQVSITSPDGEDIEPANVSGEDSLYGVTIQTSVSSGEGYVSNGTTATWGDRVRLDAHPDDGWSFDGWYEDGELVSRDADWTFRAERDRDLEARFVTQSDTRPDDGKDDDASGNKGNEDTDSKDSGKQDNKDSGTQDGHRGYAGRAPYTRFLADVSTSLGFRTPYFWAGNARMRTGLTSGPSTSYVSSPSSTSASSPSGTVKRSSEPSSSAKGHLWKRLGGSNRYETMSRIVSEGFERSDWAVVATGEGYPDALVASALAGARGCPVLLTEGKTLTSETWSQLERLGVKEAYVMGGAGAISDSVASAVSAMGIRVHRVSGDDRAGTSVEALKELTKSYSSIDTVIVSTGDSFADALSVGPYSYAAKAPIVLASKGSLKREAIDAVKALKGVKRIVLVGGRDAVSDDVRSQLGDGYEYVRLGGANRYETSARVAAWAAHGPLNGTKVCVATGKQFPDALVGAAFAGKRGAVLCLEDGTGSVSRWLESQGSASSEAFVLGGEAAIPSSAIKGLGK